MCGFFNIYFFQISVENFTEESKSVQTGEPFSFATPIPENWKALFWFEDDVDTVASRLLLSHLNMARN